VAFVVRRLDVQSRRFECLGESRVIKSVFPWVVEQGACHGM
jgi:hypothetical protein